MKNVYFNRSRIILILLLVFSLAALICIARLPGPEGTASPGGGSGFVRLSSLMTGDLSAVSAGRTQDQSVLESLRCNDYTLPEAEGSFYYSIVDGDEKGLDPVIEAFGEGELSLAFEEASLDDDFLRAGKALKFTAYTDSSYAQGELYFTTLPVITIDVTEADANGTFDITDREDRVAAFSLFDNREGIPAQFRVFDSDTTIHMRGATSAYTPKKSYRLSLYYTSAGQNERQNKRALLGMRYDEDWILYAAGGDPERIRNAFFNNLWYRDCSGNNWLSAKVGVESRFVEVILNGQYAGLYSLMHPLDAKQAGLPDDGYLYRGISYDETTPDELRAAENTDTVAGWELRSGSGEGCWEPLADYFDNLSYSFDWYSFEDWADEHLDKENVIDLHLFLSLIQGLDNYYKNNNVIAYPVGDTYRYLLAPWDLDLTWGNMHDASNEWMVNAYAMSPEEDFSSRWNLPAEHWMEISADTRSYARDRWQQLRQGSWSDEALMAELDVYEAQIFGSGAMAREGQRWPTAQLSEDLSRFREYGLERLHYLDGYFAETMGK